jgi:hypothetical protein
MVFQIGKILALVAPVSMASAERETLIRAIIDALEGIRADEVAAVSLEVRRKIVRHNQIVPEIANLVSAKRAHNRRLSDFDWYRDSTPLTKAPVMDRRGEPMTEAETAELNEQLAAAEATARYRADGSRYRVDKEGRFVVELPRFFVRIREKDNLAGVAPLTRKELDALPTNLVKLGLKKGYLRRVEGQLVEVLP